MTSITRGGFVEHLLLVQRSDSIDHVALIEPGTVGQTLLAMKSVDE